MERLRSAVTVISQFPPRPNCNWSVHSRSGTGIGLERSIINLFPKDSHSGL